MRSLECDRRMFYCGHVKEDSFKACVDPGLWFLQCLQSHSPEGKLQTKHGYESVAAHFLQNGGDWTTWSHAFWSHLLRSGLWPSGLLPGLHFVHRRSFRGGPAEFWITVRLQNLCVLQLKVRNRSGSLSGPRGAEHPQNLPQYHRHVWLLAWVSSRQMLLSSIYFHIIWKETFQGAHLQSCQFKSVWDHQDVFWQNRDDPAFSFYSPPEFFFFFFCSVNSYAEVMNVLALHLSHKCPYRWIWGRLQVKNVQIVRDMQVSLTTF